ncbi:hypothetical protein SAMN04487989_105137 [Bizionia echini]|uniref:Uncharacterized protein n=1 Tax=Bizionia echini TaxID=649333 RepID=A0A1I5CKN5_9FLAO|nr:hypothetical protein [Bizionia echini]SFN87548.1 hypothetical protein SAMN04487989_105137 [Bizionia echini]
MNKNKLLLLTALFLIPTLIFGQAEKREKLTVGFMCGVSAGTTPLVDKMTDLIKEKKYSEISSLLESKNSGEIFLAILTLERLNQNKNYILKDKELEKIKFWKSSSILVYNCLGCFSDTNLMNELFENKNSLEEITWLNKILPIE